MKLTGCLSVMSLPDLLEWIMNSRKTGRLDVVRGHVARSIFCREGHVIACSSDDPSVLMGQFLLFHGRISEDTLREALRRQELTAKNLGAILLQMEAISHDELSRIVALKAIETIHGLFDWEEATFEFVPDVRPAAGIIEVDLEIRELIFEGARRLDELREIRRIFPSLDVVVCHTDKEPDPDFVATPMARRIYQTIDGQKTLTEILLACHASEFMGCQFLRELYDADLVSIKEIRQSAEAETRGLSLDRATKLVDQGEFFAAIEILRPLFEANPNESSIKNLLANAEVQFVMSVYREGLHPAGVPVLTRSRDEIALDTLSAEELHLLERVDGACDIKSIIWVVPMRPVEVLGVLKALLDRGVIEVVESGAAVGASHGMLSLSAARPPATG